jgi:integrase
MIKELNQEWVLRLTIGKRPRSVDKGQVVFEENREKKPYIVYDEHRRAPRGFGVKVGAHSKTYIVQRRLGQKVTKIKIGNVSDYPRIDDAREAAAKKVGVFKETGRNPNTLEREAQAADLTLGLIFETYRAHLTSRAAPAKPNTLATYDKAQKRLADWMDRKVSDLAPEEILREFDRLARQARTATEQCFRWASRATRWTIEMEALKLRRAGRAPSLTNPFEILVLNKSYRDKQQLQKEYAAKGIRNPMALEGELGSFLNALWDRRKANKTGCDFLMLGLLWGCRKSEHAPVKWKELLSKEEIAASSWVDLKGRELYLRNTKNGKDQRLPLAPCARQILMERQEWAAERDLTGLRRKFVFPAESPASRSGHYSDPNSLLGYIRQDAGIATLRPHDLRRTFGRVAETLDFSESAIKRLLNHSGDVTASYTEAEWKKLAERVQRMEDAMLATAPRVYNAVKPANSPPIGDEGGWTRKPQRRRAKARL